MRQQRLCFRCLNKQHQALSIGFERVKQPIRRKKYAPKKYSPKANLKIKGNVDGALYGECIVFTGKLSINRASAAIVAAEAGCDVHDSITQKITLLVVGMQDASKLKGYAKSSKHRKVEQMIMQGKDIRIISEADFNKLMKSSC